MRNRRPGRSGRWLISVLILALLPTPLPRVEYHNVRHHDAPGEVCEYHDHLLRWHPDATGADDVPILHWHWGWLAPGGDAEHSGTDLRLHAAHPEGVLDPADPELTLVADGSAPTLDRLDHAGPPAAIPLGFATDPFLLSARARPPRPDGPGPVDLPARSLHARHVRWTC